MMAVRKLRKLLEAVVCCGALSCSATGQEGRGDDLRGLSDCDPGESLIDRLGVLSGDDQRHIMRVTVGPAWADGVVRGSGLNLIAWRLPLPIWSDLDVVAMTPVVSGRVEEVGSTLDLRDVDVGIARASALLLTDVGADRLTVLCAISDEPRSSDGASSGGGGFRVSAFDVSASARLWSTDLSPLLDAGERWLRPGIARCDSVDEDGLPDVAVVVLAHDLSVIRLFILSAASGEVVASESIAWSWASGGALGDSGDASSGKTPHLTEVGLAKGEESDETRRFLVTESGWALKVEVDFKAHSGRVVAQSVLPFWLRQFGRAVELDDLDGDGVKDYAVGAPGHASSLAALNARTDDKSEVLYDGQGEVELSYHAGAVLLVSGQDLALASSISGRTPAENFGTVVMAYPDVDGDGLSDVLVTAPVSIYTKGPGSRIRLISSGTGNVLSEWPTHSRSEVDTAVSSQISRAHALLLPGLGESLVLAPDLDGDGYPEILATVADGVASEGSEALGECPEAGLIWLSSKAFVEP